MSDDQHIHPHAHAHAHGHGGFHDERMAAFIEAEGALAAGITDQAIQGCVELLDTDRSSALRIADLGCGPGVATTQLAEAFDGASVVGVDGSQAMLERAGERAARHGVSDRVELVSLDLNDDLRELGSFDLVWAAQSLHHIDDERAAIDNFAAMLRPQGLLCLLERADPTIVQLDDDLGRPGIWDRVQAAQLGAEHASNYADMLQRAGLELLDTRTLTDTVSVSVDQALQPAITRHVHAALRILRHALDPADVAALAAASERPVDKPWGDARVTSSRALFIARKVRDLA